jgi:hypothetical protein
MRTTLNMSEKIYTPVWHKYRPAILKLMIDAAEKPQQYQLSAHEFQALNSRKKGGFNFLLQVANGKAINKINDNVAAQDLLAILQMSPKGSELIEKDSYEIMMDKQFILHISKLN